MNVDSICLFIDCPFIKFLFYSSLLSIPSLSSFFTLLTLYAFCLVVSPSKLRLRDITGCQFHGFIQHRCKQRILSRALTLTDISYDLKEVSIFSVKTHDDVANDFRSSNRNNFSCFSLFRDRSLILLFFFFLSSCNNLSFSLPS